MEDPEDMGFGLVGVAPEASLYMYRIFGCSGYTTTEMSKQFLSSNQIQHVSILSNTVA
jgi:hypothetical protein